MNRTFIHKLRKPLALILALLLIASLAGCRKKDDSGSTEGIQDPIIPAPNQSTEQLPPETTTEAPTEETASAPTEAPTEPSETEISSSSAMGTVTASKLNIRKQPGTAYESVGSYKKGDRVEILEIKNGWGRTDKGWISLEHVDLDSSPDNPDEDNSEIETDGKTKVKGYGVVILKTLNVRSGPGTKYDDIGDVTLGERFAYYQKSGSWVRIDEGWVSASYLYIEGTTGEGAGTGTVIEADLNIRTGPGKDYERIGGIKMGEEVKILAQVNSWGYTGEGWVSMRYVQMEQSTTAGNTGDAVITGTGLNIRKEPKKDAEIVGHYSKGDKVQILEVKDGWGRTDQGWVSMDYVQMIYSTGTGIVTATSLNIRKEPDKNAEKVGNYVKGDEIKILEVKGDWGRTDKGWVSMEYVKVGS